MVITNSGIDYLNEMIEDTDLEEIGYVICPEDLKESFPYVYPIAHSIGWDTQKIRDSIKMYEEIKIEDSIAGVSLRHVLSVLIDVSTKPICEASNILAAYGNSINEVSPVEHGLGEILDIFNQYHVKSRDIYYIFGFPAGIDFIDLMYARKMGNI